LRQTAWSSNPDERMVKFPRIRAKPIARIPAQSQAHNLSVGVLLYAYGVLLGAAYLFAFWRVFGFNIFPLLSLADYLTLPLDRVVVLVSVPALSLLLLIADKKTYQSRELSWLVVGVLAIYAVWFVTEYHTAFEWFLAASFSFRNEQSVLVIAALVFAVAVLTGYLAWISDRDATRQTIALILMQLALVIISGYSDGKAVFNGSDKVHFLGNKDLCEQGGVRDWIYLGTFGGRTIFMNSIDKRLCVRHEKDFLLEARAIRDSH